MKKITKIVDWLLSHEDTEPFREPVDWKGLELLDYPQIISKMMDLGTVKRKLDRGQYPTTHLVANDIRLVWSNCMTYNAEGSDFWLLAKSFLRRFEDRYRKIRKEYDVGESYNPDPPSKTSKSKAASKDGGSKTTYVVPSCTQSHNLDARAQFGSNLFLLSGNELGHIMTRIEVECPEALESWGGDKVEINVDAIPPEVFLSLQDFVDDRVGMSTKKTHGSSGGSSNSRPKKKKRSN